MPVRVVYDSERACGWRKPGGYYFTVAADDMIDCPLLPIEICKCPTCGHGPRFSRAWQWIDGGFLTGPFARLRDELGTSCKNPMRCAACWDDEIKKTSRIGFVWVGEKHYPFAENWLREAYHLGISRRLHVPPRNFVVGETWVAFAHPKGRLVKLKVDGSDEKLLYVPAIVAIAQPKMQYVVRPTDKEDKLQQLRDRDIEPVRVEKAQVPIVFQFGDAVDDFDDSVN